MKHTQAEKKRLAERIRQVSEFLADPPGYVRRTIKGLKGAGIYVTVGTDIESCVTSKGKNIAKRGYSRIRNAFLKDCNRTLANERLSWNWDENTGPSKTGVDEFDKPVSQDGDRIECRTHPASPIQAAHIIEQTMLRFGEICKEHKLKTRQTSGHLHLGFEIHANDGVDHSQETHDKVYQLMVAGIVDFQETYPALFLRPRIVDRKDVSGFMGTSEFSFYDHKNCGSSLRKAEHDDFRGEERAGMEGRASKNSSWHTITVYMSGIEHGLRNAGKCLLTGQPHRLMMTCDNGEMRSDENVNTSFNSIMRGKFGFLDLIKLTAQNLCHRHPDVEHGLSPQLQIDLIRSVIRDYKEFLDSKKGGKIYTKKEISDIKRELNSIQRDFTAQKKAEMETGAKAITYRTSNHPQHEV